MQSGAVVDVLVFVVVELASRNNFSRHRGNGFHISQNRNFNFSSGNEFFADCPFVVLKRKVQCGHKVFATSNLAYTYRRTHVGRLDENGKSELVDGGINIGW